MKWNVEHRELVMQLYSVTTSLMHLNCILDSMIPVRRPVRILMHRYNVQVRGMANGQQYDYSSTAPFMEPFRNPFGDVPFISDMQSNYGSLWQFKDCVAAWTFGFSRFKNFVYLRHREKNTSNYLVWNTNEKVTFIELHHSEYVVIALQAVDDDGRAQQHTHSLVIKVHENGAQFDMDALMDSLPDFSTPELAEPFRSQFLPWHWTTVESLVRKLGHVFQALDRYALQNCTPSTAAIQGRRPRRPIATAANRSTSATQQTESRGSAGKRARSNPRLSNPATAIAGESSRQRKKLRTSVGPSTAGSSGSALTTVQGRSRHNVDPVPDYQKFAETRKDFWEKHKSCYIFDELTYKVSIDQCYLANDEYVIRKLEKDIVEDVKKELVQLGDIKQRQILCLTPVDSNLKLLKKKPSSWEEISDGYFMIINGQHSITASKELQREGCGEERRMELRTWDAYIVWTLDSVQLHNISKFYNSTNHLNHAQPTWGNQIVSGRNIWLHYGRPTNSPTEAATRQNNAVLSNSKYSVRPPLLINYPRVEDTNISSTSRFSMNAFPISFTVTSFA